MALRQDWLADALINLYYLVANGKGYFCPASEAFHTMSFLDVLQLAPFGQDLQPKSPAITQILQDAVSGLRNTKVFVAGGEYPGPLEFLYAPFGSPFGKTPNDGVIGLDSALAFNSGFTVYPFSAFPNNLSHTELPGNPAILENIANQAIKAQSPELECMDSSSACEGALDTQFDFAGTGFGSGNSSVQLYSQDSTGIVTPLQTASLTDSDGHINWTMPPKTQPQPGLFSLFAFDSSEKLASNNLMQTVNSPITVSISPETVSLFTGSTQGFTSTVVESAMNSVSWSIEEGSAGGSITSEGLYTAPANAGVFHVVATSEADSNVTATATVTVFNVSSGITISPTSVTVQEGTIQNFTAMVLGGGGETWSVQEGAEGGAVTSTGVYTAPSMTGTFHVAATSVANSSLSAIATVTVVPASSNTNEWTWMSGSNTANAVGVYGALGVPSASNIPGSRDGASSWTDKNGNLWLFGGDGLDSKGFLGSLNDLWEFDRTAGTWIWVSGSTTVGAAAVYGTQGVPATTNVPGGRYYAVSWIDSGGKLWLFGGDGVGSNNVAGFLDDLWEFDPSAKTWTWVSGNSMSNTSGIYGTQGVPATSNVPGGRYYSVGWIDSSGNFWLFGGDGFDSTGFYGELNDLWEFSPSAKTWTWVGGSSTANVDGVYGTVGIPAVTSFPGSRSEAVGWIDRSGKLWLFGGNGWNASGGGGVLLNDLWEFDPNTKAWTWISGSSTTWTANDTISAIGIYGTKGVATAGNTPGGRINAASWIDSSGNPWLMGGIGYDSTGTWGYLNDLWSFSPTTMEWTWVGGSSIADEMGDYGALGVPASANVPGSRFYPVAWSDGSGYLWLFGGEGYDSRGVFGSLNDLWRYQP